MKQLLIYLYLFSIILLINSCKDDDSSPNPSNTANYSQLAVGNYWIYEQYILDSASAPGVANSIIDSVYVEKDTVINGITFYKTFRDEIYNLFPDARYLRDSLHYLVDHEGRVLFSSQDFTNVFEPFYNVVNIPQNPNDTVAFTYYRMTDINKFIAVPSGTYPTLSFSKQFHMWPNYTVNGLTRRAMHNRYAANIGMVLETFHITTFSTKQIERRLIRYHVQ